jgi:hypothetical protein
MTGTGIQYLNPAWRLGLFLCWWKEGDLYLSSTASVFSIWSTIYQTLRATVCFRVLVINFHLPPSSLNAHISTGQNSGPPVGLRRIYKIIGWVSIWSFTIGLYSSYSVLSCLRNLQGRGPVAAVDDEYQRSKPPYPPRPVGCNDHQLPMIYGHLSSSRWQNSNSIPWYLRRWSCFIKGSSVRFLKKKLSSHPLPCLNRNRSRPVGVNRRIASSIFWIQEATPRCWVNMSVRLSSTYMRSPPSSEHTVYQKFWNAGSWTNLFWTPLEVL